jgi:hypothetical protein
MSPVKKTTVVLLLGVGWVVFGASILRGADTSDLREELRQLREQNTKLEQQLQKQQSLIEVLSHKVGDLERVQPTTTPEPQAAGQMDEALPVKSSSGFGLGRLNISGEGGVGFFHSGTEGAYPHGEFRLDEARLFIEAPVVDQVYFYGELNLATREEPDVQLRVGELYVDFENVSGLWNQDRLLNVRAGRIYIPFGEEYLTRYAIDNPFISHSISDLWGVDEGLELYGRAGKFSYVAAVQNGGIPDTEDFTSDKSLAGRIGYDPTPWLHLSASGMRTGEIDVRQDQLSAMWFGGGFFRSLGSAATTRFQAELAEGDIRVQIPHGHLAAIGGYSHYHDNDPAGNNQRDTYYYSIEGVHDLIGKFYGGARFSQMLSQRGFPIVGNGDFGDYFIDSLTTDLWRLSLDVGYRWNQNLLLKAEYTFERGTTVSGANRNDEDVFAVEAAFKF